MIHELREHQATAVDAIERTLPLLAVPSMVVQAPTGAGKTAIADALCPDVAIAPGIDLVRQLRGRIRGASVHTIQSLSAALDRGEDLPEAGRVVVDEGRCVAAPKWRRVPEYYLARKAQLVILDATPATPEGAGLGAWASAIYQVATMRSLIDKGFLVPYRIIASEEVAESPVRVWLRHLNGRRTLVFCRDKAAAAKIADEFTAAGIPAAVISDSTPEKRRRELLGWADDDGQWHDGLLAKGELWILVCAQILRQGIDIPEVEGIILDRRCDSYPLFQQAVGRGGRPCSRIGKRDCIVVDMVGELTDKHGLPTDHKVWTLGDVAAVDAEPLPLPVPCPTPGCRTYGRGLACSFCGAPLPAPFSPEAKRETLTRIVRQLMSEGQIPWGAKKRYFRAYGVVPPSAWTWDIIQGIEAHRSPDLPTPIAPREVS
jgi:superfamily II DNA or RNA helicase